VIENLKPKLRKNIYLSILAWRQIRELQARLKTPEKKELTEREVVEKALNDLCVKLGLYDLTQPCEHMIPQRSGVIYCKAKSQSVQSKFCIECKDWNKPLFQAKKTPIPQAYVVR